jgi:hypothetical protein
MVTMLGIEIWVIHEGSTKKGGRKSGGWVEDELQGLLGFMVLVCVWVYFCCCSTGCWCQGFQGAGVVYSWYSRLDSG